MVFVLNDHSAGQAVRGLRKNSCTTAAQVMSGEVMRAFPLRMVFRMC